jgi:serine protease Do
MARCVQLLGSLLLVLVIIWHLVPEVYAAAYSSKIVPPEIIKELKKAEELISVERLEKALGILRAIDPHTTTTSSKINILLGKIYLRLYRPSKAAELFERASLSSMEDSEAYLGLAEANLALGIMYLAKRYAKKSLRSNPDLVGARLVLASIDDRMGKTARAKERFSRLMRNQSSSEPVIMGYAKFLSQRENIGVALKVLKKYMRQHPYAASAGDLMGQLYWQHGQQEIALQTRANAAKAFLAKGNVFRANAIKSWLSANDKNGQYEAQLSPGTQQNPPEIERQKTTRAPPVPPAIPVPEVKEVKLPEVRRPQPKIGQNLIRPDPLPLPEGVLLRTGSGFIINGGRHVITNRHVIIKTGKIAIRTGTGEVRMARVLEVAPDDDLAILVLARPFPSSYAIKISQMGDAAAGSSALVMGFPMASIFGWRQPSLTEGIVSKSSGLNDDPNTFLISSKMNKGNSGGPIFDRQGQLIGIAVAKLDKTAIYEQRGSLPEDVNIGIKVSRLLNFLNKSGGDSQSSDPKISLEELYQGMLSKVVLVAAEAK